MAKDIPLGTSEHREGPFEAMIGYRDSYLSEGWPVLSFVLPISRRSKYNPIDHRVFGWQIGHHRGH